MKAITVEPKTPGSARWEEIAEPELRNGSVLAEAIAVGLCGTGGEPEKKNGTCDLRHYRRQHERDSAIGAATSQGL